MRRACRGGFNPMAFSIGITLALVVGAFARWLGLDRDRAFYSAVAMVVGSYYVLFAVLGGPDALLLETAICLGFVALAAAGFKRSQWLVAAALLGHGLFDLVHGHAIDNPGVPTWWPYFCAGFDVAAGAWLGLHLLRARRRAA